MTSRDDGPTFQIGKKARGGKARDEGRLMTNALRAFKHVAKQTAGAAKRGFRAGKRAARATARARASWHQRCSVRMNYKRNETPGQWRSYGAYMDKDAGAREENRGKTNGYTAAGEGVDPAQVLNAWQVAGDELVFRFIVSPEFGDKIDMAEATRVFVTAMERDLGTKLEWVAADHHDTDNPHTHLAVRGRREDGRPLLVPSDYVKGGLMRERAENAVELQLGPRTPVDIADAAQREVQQQRFTGLDRMLKRIARAQPTGELVVDLKDAAVRYQGAHAIEARELGRRLAHLETMGLASHIAGDRWQVRGDFDSALRAVQKTNDRLKQKYAHAATISDPRLPMKVTDMRNARRVVGRVISHGEEESSGKMFTLIEGRDATLHYILHNNAMRDAWRDGQMKPGSVVDLKKTFERDAATGITRSKWSVKNWGPADQVIADPAYLRDAARSLEPAAKPEEVQGTWAGWLGRHDQAVQRAATLKRTDRGR